MSGFQTDESFRKMYLGDFEPDISFGYLLKRVKQEPCLKIAEELHFAHKRNELHKAKIAELEALCVRAKDCLSEFEVTKYPTVMLLIEGLSEVLKEGK